MQIEQWDAVLTQSGFWPQSGPVKVIESHISWIFLVGDRAYKMKKPVDFGFVDFSTLEKRRFYCEEELRLNRRLAPELYLGIRSLTGSPAEPRFEGDGEPIEFVVEMHRFDQSDLLLNLDRAGELTLEHIDQLARITAKFHERCPAAPPTSSYGTPEAVSRANEENFEHLLRGNPSREREERLYQLRSWTREAHRELHQFFELRRSDGWIRECHGDLHLGNIILRDGAILVFDCIEFNAALRWIDVLSDAAFCIMDLERRGQQTFANQFLNTYLEITGDYDGVTALRFYLLYRAMVRAKIAWIKLQDTSEDAEESLQEEYSKYLSLAETYTLRRPCQLIVMHGVSGTGKSYGSEKVVRETGAIRIRSDVERKRIASQIGTADLYTRGMNDRTYARLHSAAAACLRAGFSVVLDGAYLGAGERSAALAVANDLNVPCRLVNVTANEETLEARIRHRQEEKADPSDADVDVMHQQMKWRESLTDDERRMAIDVDTEDPECWEKALRRLNLSGAGSLD